MWLKADATDLKVALQESQSKVWNGDADLGDGKLAKTRTEYEVRLAALPSSRGGQHERVSEVIDGILSDIPQLKDGLNTALSVYQRKLREVTCPQQSVLDSCWEVAEYNILLQQAHTLQQRLVQIQQITSQKHREYAIQRLVPELQSYLKNLLKKKRTPATHVLVVLASDEERQHRPFSVPIQFVPYKSIKDDYIRDLTRTIKRELTSAGILVVGNNISSFLGERRSLWKLIISLLMMHYS